MSPPSSHPSALLLFTHLSLLPLPSPPKSIQPPLPLALTAPTSSRTSLRDHVLQSLSSLLPDHGPALKNSTLPTPAENIAFVNAAVTYLEKLRKEGVAEGAGGWWWAEAGGTVRRSDLGEACGGRYEHVLLALSCEVVWSEINKLTASSRGGAFADLSIPQSAEEMLAGLPRLLQTYQDLVKASLEFQTMSDGLAKQIESGWEALGERRDAMDKTGPRGEDNEVSLDRLEAIKASKEEAWAELVGQWLDMERVGDDERKEFDANVKVVDQLGGAGGAGGAIVGQGGGMVGRLEMANAMERTRLLPDTASLLQEHLAALPATVDALETRLTSAEEAAMNRHGGKRPSKVKAESAVSEQLAFWTEKAKAETSKNASQVGREGDVVSRERHAESTTSSTPINSLLDLTTLAPPRLSAADRARQILAALSTTAAPPATTPPPPRPRSPPPSPRLASPARRQPPTPRRMTPRKVGRPSAAAGDLRRQVLASARKKTTMMPRTPAKTSATPRLGRLERAPAKADDGWEEDGDGKTLTLDEMRAAAGSSAQEDWDNSFTSF